MKKSRKFIYSKTFIDTALDSKIQINLSQASDNIANLHGFRAMASIIAEAGDQEKSETISGRWYVCLVPASVATNAATFNAWYTKFAQQLHGVGNTNFLEVDFIWGSGVFACSDRAPAIIEFAPRTSRNMTKGDKVLFILQKDHQEGLIDHWTVGLMMSGFFS